jgi:predicted secreted protein
MASAGKDGGLYIGANKVAEIADIKLTVNNKLIDITNLDSQGWEEVIAGLKAWSISANGNLKLSDTNGQVAIRTAAFNGTSVSASIRYTSAAAPNVAGTAFIESLDESIPVGDKQTIGINLRGSGTLVYTAA